MTEAPTIKNKLTLQIKSYFFITNSLDEDEGSITYIMQDLEGLTLFSQRETIKSPCLLTLRVSESVTEPETATVTGAEIVFVIVI